MPDKTITPKVQGPTLLNNILLQEAQISFLEEIHIRGGSFIATSHAFQITSAELARRSCLLGLMSYWQATDYDSSPTSNQNLPSFIALEDCLVALEERHGSFEKEENLLALRAGINKMKHDEKWSMDNFFSFLQAGETLFSSCRDEEGVTSVFAPMGLDALDRTSSRILRENPNLRDSLHDAADAQIETYFDHLTEEEITAGSFDIFSIARGEQRSPAWIAGKLLAMGLIPLFHPSLDPVLDAESRSKVMDEMNHSALTIATHYADSLSQLYTKDRGIGDANRHIMRLRLAAAEAELRQMTELTAHPYQVMDVLDHLDRAAKEAGPAANHTIPYSFAGHTRLHMHIRNYPADRSVTAF